MSDRTLQLVGLAAILGVVVIVIVYLLRSRITSGQVDWKKGKGSFEAAKMDPKETEATLAQAELGKRTDVAITGNTRADLTKATTGEDVKIVIGGVAQSSKTEDKK